MADPDGIIQIYRIAMKANILYTIGILALIGYGIYSIIAYPEGEREQGYFLIPFGLVIALVFYFSTRSRPGK